MYRLLRVGPPKFGHKPLVVRVVGPPRPEFRLDSTAVGNPGLVIAWVAELIPVYRPGGGGCLRVIDIQGQIDIDLVAAEFPEQLAEYVVGKTNVKLGCGHPLKRAVHAVVVIDGEAETDPIHMQTLEPGNIVRWDEGTSPPGRFPVSDNQFVSAIIPCRVESAQGELKRGGRSRRR